MKFYPCILFIFFIYSCNPLSGDKESETKTATDSLLKPSNAEQYLQQANMFLQKNQSRQAKEALEKCLSIDPENIRAMLKLAEIHTIVKLYDQSNAYINKLLEIDPNNALAYFMKGYNYKEMGDTGKAISNMQTAVEKNQEYYDAHLQLGILYASKRNPVAVNYYKNALNIKPKSAEAHFDLAVYYQHADDLNKAIEEYTTIITSIDSTYSRAYYNLGYIHSELLGLNKEARNYYGNAAKHEPNYLEALYMRGLMSERLGDIANARRDYESVLKINSQYSLAIEGIKRIANK